MHHKGHFICFQAVGPELLEDYKYLSRGSRLRLEQNRRCVKDAALEDSGSEDFAPCQSRKKPHPEMQILPSPPLRSPAPFSLGGIGKFVTPASHPSTVGSWMVAGMLPKPTMWHGKITIPRIQTGAGRESSSGETRSSSRPDGIPKASGA